MAKKKSEPTMQALRDWKPGFLELPVHRKLQHQVTVTMEGIEDAVVIGALGVGKSRSVERECKRIMEAEAIKTIDDPSHLPVEVIHYEASKAIGPKTALLDLYEGLFGSGSRVGARFQTPANLRAHIANEIIHRNIRLICIDEAQLISPDNLDLLRQVPDAVRANGHAMGLILIGTVTLRDSLVAIRQMGQRFSGEVVFKPISRSELAPHLACFHPHLPALKEDMGARNWAALEELLFRKVNGSFRRVVRVLENANQLVLKYDRAMDEKILRAAIDKLAAED